MNLRADVGDAAAAGDAPAAADAAAAAEAPAADDAAAAAGETAAETTGASVAESPPPSPANPFGKSAANNPKVSNFL